MKKKIALLIAVCSIILCVLLLSKPSSSGSTISVEEFIASQNGDLGIKHVIALTELSDEHDLVFYYTPDDYIAANIILKNNKGVYIGLVMTTTQSPEKLNRVTGSTRQAYLSEFTLCWGIARSPEWTIDHPNSHQIIIDDLVLGYYFHNKPLDEEILDLKFVHKKS